jgi:hypothetical protein
LVRWLPVWFAAALVLPATLLGQGMALVGSQFGMSLFGDLGIALRESDIMVHGSPLQAAVRVTLILAGVALAQGVLSLIPFVRHVLHLWCPEVHRAHLVLRLIRHARQGAFVSPRWHRDWSAWLMLSRFRLRKVDRVLLKQLAAPEQRLHALGLLPDRDGRTDWDRAEAEAEERLGAAMLTVRPLLHALFLLVGVLGSMGLFAGATLRLIQNLSAMSF